MTKKLRHVKFCHRLQKVDVIISRTECMYAEAEKFTAVNFVATGAPMERALLIRRDNLERAIITTNLMTVNLYKNLTKRNENMDEKKDGAKISELIKPGSKVETLKRAFANLKNCKAKTSVKKVGRSRTQKGHKNY